MEVSQRWLLFGIFTYLFLDVISFSIFLPWSVLVFKGFKERDDWLVDGIDNLFEYANSLFSMKLFRKVDGVLIGGITSSCLSLAQLVSSPIIGDVSDRLGRKRTLIILQVLSILQDIIRITFGCHSLFWFIVSRIICGLTRCSIAVASASISDSTDKSSRTKSMALVGLAYSIGFSVGPPLSASLLGRLTNAKGLPDVVHLQKTLASVSLALDLVNLAIIAFMMVETRPSGSFKELWNNLPFTKARELLDPRKLLAFDEHAVEGGGRLLRWLAFAWFAFVFVFSGFEFTLLWFARERFAFSSSDQGRIFLVVGVSMMILQGGFIRRFQVGNEVRFSLMAVFSLIIGSMVLSLSSTTYEFWFGVLAYALASSAFVPSLNGAASLMAKKDRQGAVQGRFRSLNALARGTGPMIFSLVFSNFGPTYCFATYAALLPIVGFVLYRIENELITVIKKQE